MEQLEELVSRYAAMPARDRLAGSSLVPFTKLNELIHRLVDTAESLLQDDAGGGGGERTTANGFVFLEQAETWCDALESFIPEDKGHVLVASASSAAKAAPGHPVQATPLAVMAHQARLRTFGAARDAYRRLGNWPLCLRYAERVDGVSRAILSFVTAHASASDAAAAARVQAATVAVARTTLSVGGLLSKLDRHHSALEKARATLALITPVVARLSAALGERLVDTAGGGGDGADDAEADAAATAALRHDLTSAAALRVAALFSCGSEYDHLNQPADAIAALTEAQRCAAVETPLPTGHPLISKIAEALAALGADETSSHAPSNNSAPAGRRGKLAQLPTGATKRLNKQAAMTAKGHHLEAIKAKSPRTTTAATAAATAPQAGRAERPPPLSARPALPPRSAEGGPRRSEHNDNNSAQDLDAARRLLMTAPTTTAAASGPSTLFPPPRPPVAPPATTGSGGNGRQAFHQQQQQQQHQQQSTGVMAGATYSSRPVPAVVAAQQQRSGSASKKRVDETARRQQQPSLLLGDNSVAAAAAAVTHLDQELLLTSSAAPAAAATQDDVVPVSTTRHHHPNAANHLGASTTSAAPSASSPGAHNASRRATPAVMNTTGGAASRSGVNAKGNTTTTGKKRGGAIEIVKTMRDREVELRDRYLDWVRNVQCPAVEARFQTRRRAAITIQSAWRCAQARLEAYNRRQTLFFFIHQIQRAAANVILARYRAYVSHRECRSRIAAVKARRAEIAAVEHRQRKAIRVILRAMSTYVRKCRREAALLALLKLEQAAKLKQYDTAAVMVQRWWPIAKRQRAYWRQRNAEIAAEALIEAERRRKDTAVTNISRVYRGHLARRYAAAYREAERESKRKQQLAIRGSIDVIRTFLREVRARRQRLALQEDASQRRRDQAAARIQQGWARSLQREHMRLVHRRGRLVKRSAIIIQRCYRRFRARRDLRVLRTVSKTHALMRVEREWRQERAVRAIQCAWRQHLARARVRARKASYGRRLLLATWLLQRVGRAFVQRSHGGHERALRIGMANEAVRRAFRQRQAYAASLQAACRALLSVREAVRIKEAIEAEDLLIRRRMRREMFEDTQATKIQAVVRGHRGRIAAQEHAERLRAAGALVLWAAVKLQCWTRRVLARRELGRRQAAAWRAKQHRELLQEAHSQRVAESVDQLSRTECAGRAAIESQERGSTLMLVAQARRLGWPVDSVAAIGSRMVPRAATPDAAGWPPAATSTTAPAEAAAQMRRAVQVAESRARNHLLHEEVQTFVHIFLLLQAALPALPPPRPTPPSSAAASRRPSCPYDAAEDQEAAPATSRKASVAAAQGLSYTSDEPQPPRTSHAAPAPPSEDMDVLLATPPTAVAAAASAAPRPRDAFDEHYDLVADEEENGTDAGDEYGDVYDDDDDDGLYA